MGLYCHDTAGWLRAINAGQRKKAPPLRLPQQTPQEPKRPGLEYRGRTPPRPRLQGRGSLWDPRGATPRPCSSERLCWGLPAVGSPHTTPHSVQSSLLMPPKKCASHTAQVLGSDGEPCRPWRSPGEALAPHTWASCPILSGPRASPAQGTPFNSTSALV